jgi:hypothetical protein
VRETGESGADLSEALVDELAGIGDGHGGRLSGGQEAACPNKASCGAERELQCSVCVAEADVLAEARPGVGHALPVVVVVEVLRVSDASGGRRGRRTICQGRGGEGGGGERGVEAAQGPTDVEEQLGEVADDGEVQAERHEEGHCGISDHVLGGLAHIFGRGPVHRPRQDDGAADR